MTCIYCESPLLQSREYRHWRFCPRCEPRWVEAEMVPLHNHAQSVVGDLLLNRGRPYRNGRQA